MTDADGQAVDAPPALPAPSREGWRVIRKALRVEWAGVVLGVVVGLCWTAAKVSVPALVQGAIDNGIIPGDTAALWRWTAAIGVAAVLAACFTGLRRYWAFKVSRAVEADLRQQLFAHTQRLHFSFHDKVQTGDLMSRANTDLQQIQAFVVLIPLTISNFVTVAAVTVILVVIDPVLTLLALGSLPLLNYLGKRFSTRLHPAAMAIQRESAQLASVVEETVSGVRVVKGFGAESVQAARLQQEADDVYDASIDATKVRARFLPAMELLPNVGLILVLGYGGHQVLNGSLSLGELVAFNAYIVLLIWPLRMLGMIIAAGQRASASAQRGERGAVHRSRHRRSTASGRVSRRPTADTRVWARSASTTWSSVTKPAAMCRCSTISSCMSRPGNPSRWWARRAVGSRRSLACFLASTTSTPAASRSTASTSGRCVSAICVRPSAWCSRRPSCSRIRSPPTSRSHSPRHPSWTSSVPHG